MEASRFSSSKESSLYIIAVKVLFIVAYDTRWRNTVSRCTSKTFGKRFNYCAILQHHLCPVLRRKRRHLVVRNSMILHDNARSHTAADVTDLLCRAADIGTWPYSPDMSPCDYWLYCMGKHGLSSWVRSIGEGCSRIKYLGRYLGLREMELRESGESYILLS